MSIKIETEDDQIFHAIDKDDINLLKRLLENKQHVNILDENLMTPLQHAAYKGNKEMVQMFLDQGADVNLCQHQHRYTALHFAGLSGNAEICSLLLLAGAQQLALNSVTRTPSQMAAFVGNHDCVAIINNFIPKADIECYTVITGDQTTPLLPVFVADSFHKFVMQINIHPVKVTLRILRIAGLLDHIDEITNVLELMRNKEMKLGADMNEVMAFKFHYLSTICKEVGKIYKNHNKNDDPAAAKKSDSIELFIKKLLKVNKKGDLYFMDAFLTETVRNFPFHESTLFRQMVASFTGREPIPALTVVIAAINGQRGFSDGCSVCSTCGEEKPAKKCAKCKSIQYCDRECQRLHWFVHKKACARLGQDETIPQKAAAKPDPQDISNDIQNLLSN